MDHVCLRDEDLADAAVLSTDSPARRQWMACVRCRARVAAFAEFLQPSIGGTGPEWDEADARLAAALESEIHGRALSERTSVGERIAPDLRRPSRGNGGSRPGLTDRSAWRFFRWCLSPALRPAVALAVLVVALAAIQGIRLFGRSKGDEIILRDGATRPALALEPRGVKHLPDGALSLSWSPIEGADRYDVVFFGEDLTEKKRFDASAAPLLTVPAGEMTALAGFPQADSTGAVGATGPTREGAPIFWRVIAYRGGDVISQSRIRPLRTAAR